MSASKLISFKKSGDIFVGVIQYKQMSDQSKLDALVGEAVKLINGHPGLRLVLDFRHVRYLSSAVLSELVNIHQEVKLKNGLLRLCHLDPQILEVFRVTKIDGLLDIDPDLHTSLNNLKTGTTDAPG